MTKRCQAEVTERIQETRSAKHARRSLSALVAAILSVALLSGEARGQAIAAGSSAAGVSVDLAITPPFGSDVPVTVPATPSVSGVAPTAYDLTDTLESLAVENPVTGPLVATGVMIVNASADLGVSDSATADATVNDLGAAILDQFGLTADSVQSTSTVSGECGALTALGTTTLTNPTATGPLGSSLVIDESPAPNTVLFDEGGIRVILNEQIPSGDGITSQGLTVNAIRIILTNVPTPDASVLTGDLIIAQSVSAVECDVVPTPTPTFTTTVEPTNTPLLTATATPTDIGGGSEDVGITKMHGGRFTVGQNGTYTLTVDNPGTVATTQTITVVDTLPSGLTFVSAFGAGWVCEATGQIVICTSSAPIAPGSSSSIWLTVVVQSAAYPTVTNAASVSMVGDTNAANDIAFDPTTIRQGTSTGEATATPVGVGPEVSITKMHVGAFTIGQTGTYTITVQNHGNGNTAGPITVTDPLPAGMSFVSAVGPGWACSAAGQIATCVTDNVLAPGATSSISLTVLVGEAAYPTATNSASVFTPNDGILSNKTAFDPTTIRLGTTTSASTPAPTTTAGPAGNTPTPTPATLFGPEVSITNMHTDTFTVGQTARYIITVTNHGSGSTTGPITVTDNLPTGLSYVSATGTDWGCTAATATVTCVNNGVLVPGASTSITLSVLVGEAAYPTVTNRASVFTPNDGVISNKEALDPTTIRQGTASEGSATPQPTAIGVPTPTVGSIQVGPCELAIGTTHTPAQPRPDGSLNLFLTWSANCPDSGEVVIDDALPADVNVISARASRGTAIAIDGNTVTLSLDSLYGAGRAKIRTRVNPTVLPNSEICNLAVLSDTQDRRAESQDCLRVKGARSDQRLMLSGQKRSAPGRAVTLTVRYFNVSEENRLELTLPPYTTVTGTSPQVSATLPGEALIWQDLPAGSGKVRITLQVDTDMTTDAILPASVELLSTNGAHTANHAIWVLAR